MQAIVTKFHYRSKRISATCYSGRIVVPADSSSAENHERAVHALAKKIGWTGKFIGGSLPGTGNPGTCWVFENSNMRASPKRASRTSRRASRSAHDGNAIGSLVHKAATKVAKIFTKH